MAVARVPTAILCGGRGTRLREFTDDLPKVLVEVGGQPILWHIMKGYQASGYDRFVLALGYLADKVEAHFKHAASGCVEVDREDWSITFADTGLDTPTGGRVKALRDHLDTEAFFVTYGDGIADIDHRKLLEYHRSHGRIATVTVVRPHLNFGLLEIDAAERVTRFQEKPRLSQWINGGFFVFSQGIFDYLENDSVLEAEPMQRLAAAGELMAYRHDGFWGCMDTYKDNLQLNAAWASGEAPWCTWCDREKA
jgi:glucose-1-phosphate cytidylyltransferase